MCSSEYHRAIAFSSNLFSDFFFSVIVLLWLCIVCHLGVFAIRQRLISSLNSCCSSSSSITWPDLFLSPYMCRILLSRRHVQLCSSCYWCLSPAIPWVRVSVWSLRVEENKAQAPKHTPHPSISATDQLRALLETDSTLRSYLAQISVSFHFSSTERGLFALLAVKPRYW